MKRWETPWGYDRNQAEFDRQGGLVITLVVWLFKLVVYLPFMMISYLAVKPFTDANTTTWECMLLIGIFTLLQLSVIYVLKVWMAALRARGNGWWWLIFVLLFGYCCVFSAWVIYEPCKILIGALFDRRSLDAILWMGLAAYGLTCFKYYLR